MLRSLRHSYGTKLSASDGEIGEVVDFYFDDQNWAVRYLVVDTGSWLSGRQVLISPYAFGGCGELEKLRPLELTREQIELSPSIPSNKPVSRQDEEEFHRHYGWPAYWKGEASKGTPGFPILEARDTALPSQQALTAANYGEGAEAHLRSAKAVTGYVIQASDGMSGHVCDFMVDTQSWTIRQLVIRTTRGMPGREVQIPTTEVDQISYADSTISVNMKVEAVEQPPEDNLAPSHSPF
jgi:hypothetical protein